jgi:hypothetical protein
MTNGIRSEENPDSLQFDMLDGWEELGDEEQAKITRALTKGHVEDEEWNGVSSLSLNFKIGLC